MDSKRRQRIIYAIFVISLIWGCYHLVLHKNVKSEKAMPSVESSVTVPPMIPAAVQDTGKQFGEWGGDPFAHRQVSEVAAPAGNNDYFRLSAISEADGVFWAVINGRVVKSGDQLGGWTVVRIDRSRAVLDRDGETTSLSMEGD